MLFKSKLAIAPFFLLAFFLSLMGLLGCGLKIGEENKTKDTAEVHSIACIDKTIVNLKLYYAGDASNDQITESVQCLQDVFVSFKENIRGENKDFYTAKEVATFIEKNFIKDGTTFTDEFLAQFMNFKVALIGGTSQHFHKSEIDKIVRLFALLKPDLVQLNKSMKIISFNWTALFQPASEEQKELHFQVAKEDLFKLIQKISGEFIKTGNAYQIDDMLNFAKEILKFSKSKDSALQTIENARPFIKKFKIILIGGSFSLADSEWHRIGSTLHEGLFQTLRYEYFLKDLQGTNSDTKWHGYEKIAIDLSDLIEHLLDAKETKTLSNFELHEILQSLDKILPKLVLSMPLIESIGHMKVMLLGNSPSGRLGWSKSDFALLRNKIPNLFKQITTLIKTYEYLKNHKDNQGLWRTNLTEFESIESDTLAAVQELTKMIEHPYNGYYLKILIQELSKGPFSEALVLPDNFESFFNVGLAIKTVITGEEDNNINISNLKSLLLVGARAYLNYIEYDIFLAPHKLEEAAFYTHANRIFDKIIATLNLNLNLKDNHYYSSKELTQLILALQTENIIGTKLTPLTFERMFAGLWSHLLNPPENRLNNKKLIGFNSQALGQLKEEGNIFLKTQKILFEIFENNSRLNKSMLIEIISNKTTGVIDREAIIGLTETLNLVKVETSLNLNGQGFLKILTPDVGQYFATDLFKSNISRGLSRVFIRSYAGDLPRVQNLVGITLAEAETAFKHFKGIAVDFGLLEPDNIRFIFSRFLEANLFLGTSNGDSVANFGEVHQLLIHLMSGISRADMLELKIVKKCLPPPHAEITAKTAVWEECLLKVYFDESESFLDLPQFINLKTQFNETEMKEYYLSLLKAAGHIPNDKKVVYFSEADLFPHVAQYIEMVYSRHDLNKDNILEKCEALKAFPVYRDLIKELTEEYNLKEKQLPGVFIYLLKFGRPPKTALEKLKFLTFINSPSKWDIKATRLDLGKIFNYIAEATKEKLDNPPAPKPPVAPPTTPVPTEPDERPIITGCEVPAA